MIKDRALHEFQTCHLAVGKMAMSLFYGSATTTLADCCVYCFFSVSITTESAIVSKIVDFLDVVVFFSY